MPVTVLQTLKQFLAISTIHKPSYRSIGYILPSHHFPHQLQHHCCLPYQKHDEKKNHLEKQEPAEHLLKTVMFSPQSTTIRNLIFTQICRLNSHLHICKLLPVDEVGHWKRRQLRCFKSQVPPKGSHQLKILIFKCRIEISATQTMLKYETSEKY